MLTRNDDSRPAGDIISNFNQTKNDGKPKELKGKEREKRCEPLYTFIRRETTATAAMVRFYSNFAGSTFNGTAYFTQSIKIKL